MSNKTFAYALAYFANGWFCLIMIYFAGFILNVAVPKSIDYPGSNVSTWASIFINTLLITVFGIQHSVMARKPFKEWLTRWIPEHLERSIYFMTSNLMMTVLIIFWQPISIPIWSIDSLLGRGLVYLVFILGCLFAVYSMAIIGSSDFIGIKQIEHHFGGKEYSQPPFQTPSIYKYIRHPIMLGTLIVFWATPLMTLGHLIFAIGMTVYTVIGVYYEEKDLIDLYGDEYREYTRRAGMFFPLK